MTKSETLFMKKLEDLQIKYIYQKGFIKGNFHCIVDFYLPKPYKVCIEIDGEYHSKSNQKIKDIRKDFYLKSRGFKIIRITNMQVETLKSRDILCQLEACQIGHGKCDNE